MQTRPVQPEEIGGAVDLPSPPLAVLDVRDDAEGHWRFPIEDEQVVVGRSAQVPIRLNCATVSRRHAELYRDPFGRWWVRDLGSRNGTLFGGRAVREALLSPGEPFTVGRFTLALQWVPPTAWSSADHDGAAKPQMDQSTQQDISILGDFVSPKIDTSHLSTLSEFTHRLLDVDDSQERLRLISRLMVRHDFRGRRAVALRIDRSMPGEAPEVLCPPQAATGLSEEIPAVSSALLKRLSQTGQPVLARQLDGTSRREMQNRPPAAVACPLRTDRQSIDVLYVTFPAEYGTDEWLALVSLVVEHFRQTERAITARQQAQASAAIEQELARASEIQRRLVPENARVKGLELTIAFEPCRWVGGDYADVVPMADGRMLLTVADVCGKGLPAALVTSSLHSLVHASLRAGAQLRQMVDNINEHMCHYLDDRSFVTMVCVAIDPSSGALECLNAGHPASVIVGADGSCFELQHAINLPLGVDIVPFQTETAELTSGQLLAMFTDGLTELPDAHGNILGPEQFGQSLCNVYTRTQTRPIEQIANRLEEVISERQGEALPSDDQTFLLARRASKKR